MFDEDIIFFKVLMKKYEGRLGVQFICRIVINIFKINYLDKGRIDVIKQYTMKCYINWLDNYWCKWVGYEYLLGGISLYAVLLNFNNIRFVGLLFI